MFLFRAINDRDLDHYLKGEGIYSSLLNSFYDRNNKEKKEQETILDCCYKYFVQERENALNGMLGHVNGAKFKCNRSPWISLSKDFNYVSSEYALPQAGKFNFSGKRKPILVIDIDDDKVYDDVKNIYSLRKTQKTDFAVDLSDDRLKELYDQDIIENETTFGYHYDSNGEIYKNRIDGINNFSTSAKEVLVFGEIKLKDVKVIIYPVLQDIIYSCNIDINKNMNFIINNIDKINKIINNLIEIDGNFKLLYPYLGSNISLTDLLDDYYQDKECLDIEEAYKILKDFKKKELEELVGFLNEELKTDWKVTRLVDDKVIVSSYGKIKKYSKIQLNDIVLVEKDKKIYKYSSNEQAYINNNDKIKIKR